MVVSLIFSGNMSSKQISWKDRPSITALETLIGQEANIQLHGSSVCALIRAIDPETLCVCVVQLHDDEPRLTLYMADAVKSIEPTGQPSPQLFEAAQCFEKPAEAAVKLSREDIEAAYKRLTEQLTALRLPFTATAAGEPLMVLGAVQVKAPYGPTDCTSRNDVALGRIQSLLAKQQV